MTHGQQPGIAWNSQTFLATWMKRHIYSLEIRLQLPTTELRFLVGEDLEPSCLCCGGPINASPVKQMKWCDVAVGDTVKWEADRGKVTAILLHHCEPGEHAGERVKSGRRWLESSGKSER